MNIVLVLPKRIVQFSLHNLFMHEPYQIFSDQLFNAFEDKGWRQVAQYEGRIDISKSAEYLVARHISALEQACVDVLISDESPARSEDAITVFDYPLSQLRLQKRE